MADDLFPIDDLPGDDICHIDIDAINEDSARDANDMVAIASSLILDERFQKAHPQAQKRIALEIETLRGLIKMRKADEEAHDAVLRAITENKSNASLYRSMAEIQKTSIALTNKIHDTLDRINAMCKGFQLELPFDEEKKDEEETKPVEGVHRGSKSFIQAMNHS